MNTNWRSIALLMLLAASLAVVTACEQTASNLTDTVIRNMEEDVGGAAERSSQNAGEQAGGQICGAPLAAAFLPVSASIILVARRRAPSDKKKKIGSESQSTKHKDAHGETSLQGGK